MENGFRALIVYPHKMSEIMEFSDLTSVAREIGLKTTKTKIKEDTWETMECGIEDVGIIAHDQDKPNQANNRLGMKGTFAIVGMKRTKNESGKIVSTMFYGLTEQQARDVRLSLSLTTYKNVIEACQESEV